MDFNSFDARKAADTGAWLHLKHPATGELLYDNGDLDKPCRVKVIGSESRDAQATLRKMQKDRAKAGPNAPTKTPLQLHQDLVEMASPLVREFENVDRGPRPATLDDVEWFLNLQITNGQTDEQSFAEQIVSFAFKRASFLGNAQEA